MSTDITASDPQRPSRTWPPGRGRDRAERHERSVRSRSQLARQRQPDAGARRALQHRISRAHAAARRTFASIAAIRSSVDELVRSERMTRLGVATARCSTRAQRIGRDVAGPAADAVDREARFPREAIAALREERLLGVLVPQRAGRPRRDDRRGRRRLRDARPRLRVHRDDLRDAPDRSGLPGAPWAARRRSSAATWPSSPSASG